MFIPVVFSCICRAGGVLYNSVFHSPPEYHGVQSRQRSVQIWQIKQVMLLHVLFGLVPLSLNWRGKSDPVFALNIMKPMDIRMELLKS